MLPLIILTFLVFFILWVGDFYLTLKTIKKIGNLIELNPIMQIFLNFRGKYIFGFKFVELLAFLYLIYYLTSIAQTTQFYILLGYIVFYGLLVANNSRVYYKVTGKESLAINYILILIVVFVVLFIYLNYLLYSDLRNSYTILTQCKGSFNDLYWSCQQRNATGETKLPADLENILKSINISISKPW